MLLMKFRAVLLATSAFFAQGASQTTLTGVIGDDMCTGEHKSMGGTDAAKCTAECVKTMQAKYALWLGSDVYVLSDQKTAARYAGRKTTVTGTLNGKEIQVKSIKPAN
jgi:hypothetical protein